MNVKFAVLADYSNVTQEGKLNILGSFDIIHTPRLPFRLNVMQLVMRFEADISERKQEKDVQVRLINDRADTILELNGRLSIDAGPGEFLFYNHVLTFQNVVFKTAGAYQFDIYLDGSKSYSVPLRVVDTSLDHNP